MPACCTLRLNCFSATSNGLSGLTIIWLIAATSAIYRYRGDSWLAAGNNPGSRRGDHPGAGGDTGLFSAACADSGIHGAGLALTITSTASRPALVAARLLACCST